MENFQYENDGNFLTAKFIGERFELSYFESLNGNSHPWFDIKEKGNSNRICIGDTIVFYNALNKILKMLGKID